MRQCCLHALQFSSSSLPALLVCSRSDWGCLFITSFCHVSGTNHRILGPFVNSAGLNVCKPKKTGVRTYYTYPTLPFRNILQPGGTRCESFALGTYAQIFCLEHCSNFDELAVTSSRSCLLVQNQNANLPSWPASIRRHRRIVFGTHRWCSSKCCEARSILVTQRIRVWILFGRPCLIVAHLPPFPIAIDYYIRLFYNSFYIHTNNWIESSKTQRCSPQCVRALTESV